MKRYIIIVALLTISLIFISFVYIVQQREIDVINQGNSSKLVLVDIRKLYFHIPENWKIINEGTKLLYFNNHYGVEVGGAYIITNYNKETWVYHYIPNHSEILKTEKIMTQFGEGKIYTLVRSTPAAAEVKKAWYEFHAIMPIKHSDDAIKIWVKGLDHKLILINMVKELKWNAYYRQIAYNKEFVFVKTRAHKGLIPLKGYPY